ncbi:MAG: A/G-specific adenine glycosylase [Myxococcota bacterium]
MRAALLRWYDRHRRDLPWRRTRDPYAIWVSEVMLQQTRVDTVIPYYERFLSRFPTPRALAEADEDRVLAAWSGLGYYRRARLLHAGVREVVERYGGRVPEDPEARRGLPGVGRYTAGAIGSIAFERPEPIVDGNVGRVLARIHGIDTPLGRAVTERQLWQRAAELVRGPRPGDLNQALMELGATVCTPVDPACDACPARRACQARRTGRVAELPVRKAKRDPTPVSLTAVVATVGRKRDGGPCIWLLRGEGPLFGGLWTVPTVEDDDREPGSARRALRAAGIAARLSPDPVARLEHVLSHRRLTVSVYRATAARARSTRTRRLLAPDALAELGTSSLTQKILRSAWPAGDPL